MMKGLSPECRGYFNIWKSVDVIHHFLENFMIILAEAEKKLTESKNPDLKILSKLRVEGKFVNWQRAPVKTYTYHNA